MLVFGTRPEAIKMAPLVKAFDVSDKHECVVCVTGQHREMLDQVLSLFDITPDYDLNLMKQGQDLYDVTSGVLLGMRDVLNESCPDLVLVHGDTATSTAAALAAFYQQIPVGHVEAGLRTHNIYSPWPEEMNRQITGRIASYHFAPTEVSKQNLLNEGISEENIYVTGNTVIDALYWVLDKIEKCDDLQQQVETKLISSGLSLETIKTFEDSYKRVVLITGHRRENFGEGFINICTAIKELAEQFPNDLFIYPMHLNPNVRRAIYNVFGDNLDSQNHNVHFIEPLEYLPFVWLMNQAYLVLTDSGGIQEEAPGLGKPVLVMRDTTERPEALEAGTVKLVGTDRDVIIKNVRSLLSDDILYKKMSSSINPYGSGDSCNRIIRML